MLYVAQLTFNKHHSCETARLLAEYSVRLDDPMGQTWCEYPHEGEVGRPVTRPPCMVTSPCMYPMLS